MSIVLLVSDYFLISCTLVKKRKASLSIHKLQQWRVTLTVFAWLSTSITPSPTGVKAWWLVTLQQDCSQSRGALIFIITASFIIHNSSEHDQSLSSISLSCFLKLSPSLVSKHSYMSCSNCYSSSFFSQVICCEKSAFTPHETCLQLTHRHI